MHKYGQTWQAVGTGGNCEAWQLGDYPGGRYILATDGDAQLGFAVIYGYCGSGDCADGTELSDTGDYSDPADTARLRFRIAEWLRHSDLPCRQCAALKS